jgi:FKBP-type peptidyl-prolyl cis-trans isomerase 2
MNLLSKLKLAAALVAMLIVFSAVIVQAADKASKTDATPVAADGKSVKLHYTLKVDGELLDSSRDRSPFVFLMGAHQVVPGFEKAIRGMKAGEKKSFRVPPAEGYGEENPEAIREVSRDRLPQGMKPEAGMTLFAKSPTGRPIPVKIMEVKKDVVVMNFNHPLAGKTLDFDVEVLEVFDAPAGHGMPVEGGESSSTK